MMIKLYTLILAIISISSAFLFPKDNLAGISFYIMIALGMGWMTFLFVDLWSNNKKQSNNYSGSIASVWLPAKLAWRTVFFIPIVHNEIYANIFQHITLALKN